MIIGKSIIKYCTDGLARQAMPRNNAESRMEGISSLSMVRYKKYSDAVNKNVKTASLCISNAVLPSIKSYSDKLLLETTLRNLVSNAIKYTNENGSIWITSTIVENMYVISVKDNGIGISEENKKRIFVDYKGITRLGTKNEKGSGLGLKICKEFVQKNLLPLQYAKHLIW